MASRTSGNNKIEAIVFSRDRAIQLNALLESFLFGKHGDCPISIIYLASNERHRTAYDQLIKNYAGKASFYNQLQFDSFQKALDKVMLGIQSGRVFFLVDDIVFIEAIDINTLKKIDLKNKIFSLRMGLNLSYSYVVSKNQSIPKSLKITNNLIEWRWEDGEMEWAYPLSLDGHIFNSNEVRCWLTYLSFKSPSSLENELQKILPIYIKRLGVSYLKSVMVNIPANRVQEEVLNLHGSVHQDDLLSKWENGYIIDFIKLRGMANTSTHQEVEFEYKLR